VGVEVWDGLDGVVVGEEELDDWSEEEMAVVVVEVVGDLNVVVEGERVDLNEEGVEEEEVEYDLNEVEVVVVVQYDLNVVVEEGVYDLSAVEEVGIDDLNEVEEEVVVVENGSNVEVLDDLIEVEEENWNVEVGEVLDDLNAVVKVYSSEVEEVEDHSNEGEEACLNVEVLVSLNVGVLVSLNEVVYDDSTEVHSSAEELVYSRR
jgi:hypothetical protein